MTDIVERLESPLSGVNRAWILEAAAEIRQLREAGEHFVWVMDQRLLIPDLMLEAAVKMRAALAAKDKP